MEKNRIFYGILSESPVASPEYSKINSIQNTVFFSMTNNTALQYAHQIMRIASINLITMFDCYANIIGGF